MSGICTYNILPCTDRSLLEVRRALPEDVMDILRWRNDPHARTMSRQQEQIDEAVHRSWYSQALNDSDRLLIVGMLMGQKVGIVRFDRRQSLLWEVNIALAPEARGYGLGRRLLKMALDCLQGAHVQAEIVAVAKLLNEPSLRLFESLGFARESDDGKFVTLVLSSRPGRHCV